MKAAPVASAIPELAGPATETGAGALTYGVPGPVAGPIPVPTPEERAAALADYADALALCACSAIPDGVIRELRELARQAGTFAPWATGCPRCRPVPSQLVASLADALADREGALS
jgi:hypothetical protein